jgi:hypothetical protein
MKKISTVAAKQTKNFREQKLTIGLDLGDRSSWKIYLTWTGLLMEGHLLQCRPVSSTFRAHYSKHCEKNVISL